MSIDVDRVFTALADQTRRDVLDVLARRSPATATALARELPISRQAVVKHLAVLERSELVASARAGREMLFEVRSRPLLETASWMRLLAASWDQRLADLKARAERADRPVAQSGAEVSPVRDGDRPERPAGRRSP